MTVSDLIRRQDAIEAVENNSYGMGSRASVKAIKSLQSAEPPYQYSEAYVNQLRGERDILQDMVNNMAEPKTGEWVEEDEYGGLWVCDQCGFASEYMDNFCPNCGARMNGVRKNDTND